MAKKETNGPAKTKRPESEKLKGNFIEANVKTSEQRVEKPINEEQPEQPVVDTTTGEPYATVVPPVVGLVETPENTENVPFTQALVTINHLSQILDERTASQLQNFTKDEIRAIVGSPEIQGTLKIALDFMDAENPMDGFKVIVSDIVAEGSEPSAYAYPKEGYYGAVEKQKTIEEVMEENQEVVEVEEARKYLLGEEVNKPEPENTDGSSIESENK